MFISLHAVIKKSVCKNLFLFKWQLQAVNGNYSCLPLFRLHEVLLCLAQLPCFVAFQFLSSTLLRACLPPITLDASWIRGRFCPVTAALSRFWPVFHDRGLMLASCRDACEGNAVGV